MAVSPDGVVCVCVMGLSRGHNYGTALGGGYVPGDRDKLWW